jgi:hypothetical protein
MYPAFQFQTWIWYPSIEGIAPRAAGRLAAAAILREIEEDRFGDNITLGKLQTLSQSDEYRKIFDALIAPGGGWSSLLMTEVDPDEFDERIRERTDRAKIIADLIEYRLRAANHPPSGADRSKITHAIFSTGGQIGNRSRPDQLSTGGLVLNALLRLYI